MSGTLLVTGAAGSIGRAIRPLLGRTHRIRASDIVDFDVLSGETASVGDLAHPAFCRTVTEGVDAVIHLAAVFGPDLDFEETFAANYAAVLNLLEACRRAGVGRFVYASSHHILGLNAAEGPAGDAAPIAPDGFYGLSKAFGEAACAMYAHRFGLRTAILRIGSAAPQVVDHRRERLWVSARDMVQLIEIGLAHPAIVCEVMYAVSESRHPLFANERAKALGYRPRDQAEDNRSDRFLARGAMPAEDLHFVGGFYATAPLPAPWKEPGGPEEGPQRGRRS